VADLLGDVPRTVAYWVERFEEKGLGGLREGARSGLPSKLDADQIADLQRVLRGQAQRSGIVWKSMGWKDNVGLPTK
jgi:transposase